MPVAVNYPGVYVEEIPSGVRTITGVATSVTAFVGWAPKGPTDQAGLVLSWPDFVRQYGGLDARSLLGYAVSQFFVNGGQQAYIVRLAASDAAPATVTVGAALDVTAASPGAWAKAYGIGIKNQTGGGANAPKKFRLQVGYFAPGATDPIVVESFENLSMASDDPRFVEEVINAESSLIRVKVKAGVTAPPADGDPAAAKLDHGDDGKVLDPVATAGDFNTALTSTGVDLLQRIDLFNLLCVPGESDAATLATLEAFCRKRRAFLIADCKQDDTFTSISPGPNGSITGDDGINGALFFPWVTAPDPLSQNRPSDFPPCGFVAGIFARTDTNRGVWKAPAGTDASLAGVVGPKLSLTDRENGVLNPLAVNCIRNFKVYGTVLWGARTLRGNDEIGSEWKYIPVRRLALYIEESLFRGTKWVVFEPNDEPLWGQIRLNVGAFMHNLFRQGAFQGTTPRDAYFVKCDKETTTQNDINLGIVNIVVGFAPLKPAEFVVIQIQQMAGQIDV